MPAPPPVGEGCLPPLGKPVAFPPWTSFHNKSHRRFANKVWTSPHRRLASASHSASSPVAIAISLDSGLFLTCSEICLKSSLPWVPVVPSDSLTCEPALPSPLLQGLWSRRVASLMGDLPGLVSSSASASLLLQASRASGIHLLLLLPRSHVWWLDELFSSTVHDSALFLAPLPDEPTWR